MKYIIVLFIIIFISSCSQFDEDSNEQFILNTLFITDERLIKYETVPESSKRIFWEEEFNSSVPKWVLDVTSFQNWETTIDGGILTVKSEFSLPLNCPIRINENDNFEIEIKQWIFEGKSYQIGIDEKESFNTTTFDYDRYRNVYFSLNQKYQSSAYPKGDISLWGITRWFGFFSKDYLNCNQFNIITIRRIGEYYTIFINSKFLYILNSTQKLHTTLSVYLNQETTILDYVRISYLTE